MKTDNAVWMELDVKGWFGMKKLLFAIILALVMLCGATALAEEVILPDPGYYFGRIYDGYVIEFDEYPKEEFDAYVKLLTEQYGMQITEEGGMGADEFVFMEKPGVENTEVFVSCFESEYECGMEIIVDDGITLSVLDSYKARSSSEPGVIAWDDGRMIADPGDFLGYEVSLIDIEDYTHQNPLHMNFEYAQIPTEDIVRYAEAVDASPYFELVETSEKYGFQYHYRYTGSSSSITPSNRNLTIIINNPEHDASTFYIFEYPGFTVNSEANVNPDPNPFFETCSFCYGDGDCNSCDGKGYQQFYNATQGWYQVDCSCSFGKCPYCGGLGHK